VLREGERIGSNLRAVPRVYNVLFLCTGNSARSIMAEALMNHRYASRFRAFSAGSHPKGEVHAGTIELLTSFGVPIEGLRSKRWDEFAGPDAPATDFIITVCDQAAGEVCPVWPGTPMTAHWGIADPAAAAGTAQAFAFRRAFTELSNRINLFANLRIEDLDKLALKRRLEEIGRVRSD
jgi:arsenate reductase (thioredoxin)